MEIIEDDKSSTLRVMKIALVKAYMPRIPFPHRLQKFQVYKEFVKIHKSLKKLHVNVLFIENLARMSTYNKFMKDDIIKKKKKWSLKNSR